MEKKINKQLKRESDIIREKLKKQTTSGGKQSVPVKVQPGMLIILNGR